MTSPGDDSRTELAWREIVDNYGERASLSDDAPAESANPAPAMADPVPPTDVAAYDVDEPAEPVDEVAEVDRFVPPVAPPIPLPRTWQRGMAWAGIFLAPVLALLVAIFSFYVPSLFGWALVAWPVAGFLYLVFDMPTAPRDPWDNGSRV